MKAAAILILSLVLFAPAAAQDRLRPYLLIDNNPQTLAEAEAATREQLDGSGFLIVGTYSPFDGTQVIALTHPALLEAAASTEFGGYGAVLRLALTRTGDTVQRSVPNPVYWGTALHIGNLEAVSSALAEVFGGGQPFGSKKGLKLKKLKKYRYMMMMPKLRDHDELGSFDSHETALASIRKNLASNSNNLAPVFEVAVPGTEEVLFGVGIGDGDGADVTVMGTTDRGELHHSPHLPYALLVSGNKAYALAGKFRIALAFPDLGMGTFMKISGAPKSIRNQLASLTD